MNLLPKSHAEFAKTDYWNAFFRKRGDKAFEWYGEYLQLCDQIHKYVKSTDKILMLGCGNSKLSMDMYDVGFRDITNIDISPVAIKKMLELNACTDMKFLQMDATKMSFPNEAFSVALDKGTLDALFVDESAETLAKVESYFKEIARTMRNGGRYLCISLLQEHILKFILDYFPRHSFMVRVVHCLDAGAANQEKNADHSDTMAMPVFMVIATKFRALPKPVSTKPILEFSMNNGKMQRVETATEILEAVSATQQVAMVCYGLAHSSIAGHNEVDMTLYKPGESLPRFTMHILDQPPIRGLGKYAAFIVPQGRESEWLFSTPEGRQKLLAEAKYQRLAVITMHRDQEYETLEEIKKELTDSVLNFAPAGLQERINFLTIGDDALGRRETLVTGVSQISGEFRVEEIEGSGGKLFRRLIFLQNESVIQSEALVKTIKPKGKKLRKKIDVGWLACDHHLFMSVGVEMTAAFSAEKTEKNVLVVGLGGGGLCSFLHSALPHVRITAVEIDPIILEVAEQFFELKQDKRLHVVIDDGLHFLKACKEEAIKFDAVLIDVDSKDPTVGMSCPPQSFLEPNVLETIKHLITPKGVFILNLVCRDETLREKALQGLHEIFPAICSYKLEEDVNEVIYCAINEKYKTIDDWIKVLGASGRELNRLVQVNKLANDDILTVNEFLRELKI